MAERFKDMTGKVFGRLHVLRRAENDRYGNARWECMCDCGKVVIVLGGSLRCGNTRSCGCLSVEKAKIPKNLRHGDTGTRLYTIWKGIHNRCRDINNKTYGGRGISVCEEWSQYIPFAKWALRNGYSKNLTLDRIDVDGDYEPFNCRWATVKEQMNNRRNNRVINVEGKEYTLSELADLVGIKKTTLRARLNSGWSSKDAISIPTRKRCGAYMGGE
jgi:hypothetical protein